jgi:hypothetical protein
MHYSLKMMLTVLIVSASFKSVSAQEGLPPINGEGITLMDQNGFLVLMGAAVTSYALSEYVFDYKDKNYYHFRVGYYGSSSAKTSVLIQQLGIEKRLAPWYSIGLEVNLQEWYEQEGTTGIGAGVIPYYRWYLFGTKKIRAYLEYGAGVFYGLSKFPSNGSNFTFHLNSQIGVEYALHNRNLVRVSYGHLHQSNNGLLEPNPGVDLDGVNLIILFYWD